MSQSPAQIDTFGMQKTCLLNTKELQNGGTVDAGASAGLPEMVELLKEEVQKKKKAVKLSPRWQRLLKRPNFKECKDAAPVYYRFLSSMPHCTQDQQISLALHNIASAARITNPVLHRP